MRTTAAALPISAEVVWLSATVAAAAASTFASATSAAATAAEPSPTTTAAAALLTRACHVYSEVPAIYGLAIDRRNCALRRIVVHLHEPEATRITGKFVRHNRRRMN